MLKVKLKNNHIPNLMKRFKSLHKKKFEVGYFPENGVHPSGLTFTGLFAIQSFGSRSANIPARPVLDQEFMTYTPLNTNALLKSQLKLYFSGISSKTPVISSNKLLANVAGDYVQKVRAGFGDTTRLTSNAPSTQEQKATYGVSPPNNPLVWTGVLRDNLSYSINGQSIVTP
ncbi:hypothetical protein S140_151 [Shewanella sp. phage 1/40]|uniref:tail completion or Neck1 protein n=1 Tax=Shewanella sp. phage 1/40 TaxID=1458860 RepID=UPI0004F84C18|nr:tail completion or Neck1 protein [Shewanella sp. phage 1/40]AHK11558.1 hypothetical protein S140_151 [Shewanella sp. phage 1/40]